MSSERTNRGTKRAARAISWIVACGVLLLAVPAHAARHALLIGIGDYKAPGVSVLRGPKNDIQLVRTVLTTRLGFKEQEIVTLVDQAATHSAIRNAFEALARRVAAGDFVYIHFAGHGSYLPDKNERSGFDQTWVPYGARSGDRPGIDDLDIVDKEINAWLQPLYAKTDDVIFVSDSCHSATVSRGMPGARAAPPDTRPQALERTLIDSPAAAAGVRIGAARDEETAAELDVRDSGPCETTAQCQGVFTWNWVRALQQAKPGERWTDVFRRAYTLVTNTRFVSQRPQLEGHGDRLVQGGQAVPGRSSLAVLDVTGSTLKLDTGAIGGVTVGSTYRRVAGGASDEATLEITSVLPFSSVAKVTQGTFAAGDLVSVTKHRYAAAPIRIAIAAPAIPADAPLADALRAAAAEAAGYALTDVARADWIVHVIRPRDASLPATGLPPSSPGEPPQAWVTNREQRLLDPRMRIPLGELGPAIEVFKRNLASFAHATEVKELAAPHAASTIELKATLLRPEAGCETECTYLPGDTSRKSPFRNLGTRPVGELPRLQRGDVLTFMIRNTAQDDYYAYVIDIGADASVQPVFPRRVHNAEEALLPAGKTRDLATEAAVRFTSPGLETIKVIASEAPLDVRLFESQGYQELRAQRGAPATLVERLQSAPGVRGKDVELKWNTAQFPVEVAP